MKKGFIVFGLLFMFLLMVNSVNAFDVTTTTVNTTQVSCSNPHDMYISPDGSMLYAGCVQKFLEYDLSTPFDVTTLSATGGELNVFTQTGAGEANAVHFKNDGTMIFWVNSNRGLHSMDLSTAWDITTVSNLKNYTQASLDNSEGMHINDDGTILIILDISGHNLKRYDFGTAWDINTLSLNSTDFSFGAYDVNERGLTTVDDGFTWLISQRYNVLQINCTTAYDMGSCSYHGAHTFSPATSYVEGIVKTGDDQYTIVDNGYSLYRVYNVDPSEVPNVFTVNNTQTPSNLTTGQIGILLINTTITDTLGELGNLNDSYTTLNYDVEATANSNCGYINLNDGSCESFATIENMTKQNNSEFGYSTYELNYLPAIYTFNQSWIQQQTMSEHVVKGNSYMRMNVHNMTTNQNHIVNVEYNIEPYSTSSEYSLLVLYCNSSYTTGSPNPVINSACTLVDEVLPTESFNHCHSSESCHYVSRLNEDIVWTESGYFMFGTLGTATTDSWLVNYVENASYVTQSFSATTTDGASWTGEDHIADIHIHQFSTTDNVNYNTTFYDGEGNSQTSDHVIDYFDFANAPPTTFIINDPSVNYTINSTGVDVYFSWDSTTDPDGDDFEFRVAVTSNGLETLQNLSTLLNSTTLNYTHSFKSTDFATGAYRAYVYAIDEHDDFTLSPQTERFNVCVNDWTQLLGVCSVDNNQSITWFDANSCSIEYEKPSTTSQVCNYENSTITDEEKYINNLTIIIMLILIGVLIFFSMFTGYGIFIFFSGLLTLIFGIFVNTIINQWIVLTFMILISVLQMVLSFVMNKDD